MLRVIETAASRLPLSPEPAPRVADEPMIQYTFLACVPFVSVTPEVVRADYSLMYEQDDKIALNEGFFTARTVAGSQGWVDVTMSKTVRFTSSILNLLAPAILAMFLDNKVGGFKQLIETEVD